MSTEITEETDTNSEPQEQHVPVPDTGGTGTGTDPEGVATADTPEGDLGTTEVTEPETFPREYVEKLRKENADNRVKAKTADDLAARLHTALVTATGRLADPTDLPFDESHLEDPETLTGAIDDLLTRKSHLASRRPSGDIGQGISSDAADTVNLAGILRENAR